MRPAREYRCIFTGRRAENCHHPTCRDAAGNYLDALFVVPVVRRQHDREHQSMTWAGLDRIADRNVARLRRTGHLLVRLGEHHGDRDVVIAAESLLQLGLMLHRVADEMVS